MTILKTERPINMPERFHTYRHGTPGEVLELLRRHQLNDEEVVACLANLFQRFQYVGQAVSQVT